MLEMMGYSLVLKSAFLDGFERGFETGLWARGIFFFCGRDRGQAAARWADWHAVRGFDRDNGVFLYVNLDAGDDGLQFGANFSVFG
jgi:hypothetical protein